ncbi:GumC family protein [Maribacter sp. LLG6340-A2]|uniref:GumC family protein n=1 Tax=Maribacter sp. LLG6340-A2 TaxID=3160834 RepID=UPI00386B0BFF
MKDAPFSLDIEDNDPSLNIKGIIQNYLRYWPWFVGALLLCLAIAVLYLRYAPTIYQTTSKIKIVDETKEIDVVADPLAALSGNSKINMDNETEILKSYRILDQVVKELNLGVRYLKKGNIKTTPIWNPQFKVIKEIAEDSLVTPKSFVFTIHDDNIEVIDEKDRTANISFTQLDSSLVGLPFRVQLVPGADYGSFEDTRFEVVLMSDKAVNLELAKNLNVQPTSKNSDIIALSLRGENFMRSEAILNTLVQKFNQDGVLDRQQVSRRTIDFIDERFLYLSTELDSIEGGKEDFKKQNNLSYIEADANVSLERKSITENEVATMETQISLSELLKKSVIGQAAFELLPVDVGLENNGLNNLVDNYNALVLQRNKLLQTVGAQHPSLITLSDQLENAKVNIIKTINIYQTQLRTSLRQLNQEQSRVNSVFSRLPEKEKMLRSIERQQSIKENLFLLLLQKREEAAINFAVTAPSVKIVDYSLTNTEPVAPKKIVVLGIAGLLGLFLPFAFLYVKFNLNDKVESKLDISAISKSLPILAEIPHFKENKIFSDVNDRSMLGESFRILATNINYMLPRGDKKLGKVVYITSGNMNEGKSLIAYNLSVAYASVNKKVLLIGADLRSPEQHNYFGMGLNTKGLTDFLQDPESNWQEYVYTGIDGSKMHHVCLSGAIPPNAPQLLSSGAFEEFIAKAKAFYDIIIVDTAPTLPVTDTLLIADNADVTLFVARAGVTEKSVLEEANELNRRDKLKNMAFVLNDAKINGKKTYSYAYKEKA